MTKPAFVLVSDVRLHWQGPEVQLAVHREEARGLKAAAIFLAARIKEFLTIAAPRKAVMIRGVIQYLASQKATRGAPPRKLSGHLRRSITYQVNAEGTEAKVGTNLEYGRLQEEGFTIRAGQWIPIPTDVQYKVRMGGINKRLYKVRWIKAKTNIKVGPHKYLVPTLVANWDRVADIIGRGA